MACSKSLLDLNPDVLGCIFNQLDDFKDLLNLARAHSSLLSVFLNNKFNFKSIGWVLQTLTGKNRLFFLTNCKENIEELSTTDDPAVLKLIVDHCKNLKSIHICAKDYKNIEIYLRQMKTLEKIWIKINDKLPDDTNTIRSLSELPNLKSFYLEAFGYVDERDLSFVKDLVKLEELRITSRFEFEPDILAMCKSLVKLRVLRLKYFNVNRQTLEELAKFCPLLEKLEIGFGRHANIPYFPNLKYLSLYPGKSCSAMTDEAEATVFHQLLVSLECYKNQLETLKIEDEILETCHAEEIMKLQGLTRLACTIKDEGCIPFIAQLAKLNTLNLSGEYDSNITNLPMLSLVSECKALENLELSWLKKVDDEFVLNTLDNLDAKGTKPTKPFNLSVYQTGINRKVINELEVHPKGKLIKFEFCSDSEEDET